MPIRPENKLRYPKEWPQISKAIRDRSGQRCEKCRAPNGVIVARSSGSYMLPEGETFDAETGEFLGISRGSEYDIKSLVRIVLTVAHLDHQPENCDPDNLRAWCQRCHNVYDAPTRRAGTAKRARDKAAMGDMLDNA